MTSVLATIGSTALWLLYAWLASAVVASYVSERKGYGEKLGLAAGMLLTVVGVVVWLIVPAKRESRWRLQGPLPFGRRASKTVAELRSELQHAQDEDR